MARIRTIKPEFFTSEDIVSLSPLARLLYIATWCESDKEGRLVWKPMTFKLRYFPGDNCDIGSLCDELVRAGLVILYGTDLAYVPQFARHQHINPRESISVIPPPPDYVPDAPKKITADVRSEVMERDGGKCVRCNSTDDLTLDHILPQSLQGPHIAANLRVMCRSCNAGRPVSGKGLTDDLALDGLSLEVLRKNFGIDASSRVIKRANPDSNAQGGRERKGREGKGILASMPEDWQMPAEWISEAAAKKQGVDWSAEADRFTSHHRSKASKFVDWKQAWWTWVNSPYAKAPPAGNNDPNRQRRML